MYFSAFWLANGNLNSDWLTSIKSLHSDWLIFRELEVRENFLKVPENVLLIEIPEKLRLCKGLFTLRWQVINQKLFKSPRKLSTNWNTSKTSFIQRIVYTTGTSHQSKTSISAKVTHKFQLWRAKVWIYELPSRLLKFLIDDLSP